MREAREIAERDARVKRWARTKGSFAGAFIQQGEDVGADATDGVLETVYANGPLDTVNGNDVVLWVVVRAHHEPRHLGEELHHLPYHYEEFSVSPRNFEVFKEPTGAG